MKKLILTITALAGGVLAARTQGVLYFDNTQLANGYVVESANPDTSGTVGAYADASSFNVELFGLAGMFQTTGGLTGLDAYNFLNPADLVSDGFAASSSGVVSGSAGTFQEVSAVSISGSTGNDSYNAAGDHVLCGSVEWL